MISWLEQVVKDKVEAMINNEKTETYIKKYLDESLEKIFAASFTNSIELQIKQILTANEKKLKTALAQLNDIDTILTASTTALKEKLRSQLEKSLSNLNVDVVMSADANATFSNRIANIILRMIVDNPGFIMSIAKTKLAEHLQKIKLFGEGSEK
jgi:hypothetical protein